MTLLNGQASTYMRMGKFDDAESALQEALERVSLLLNLTRASCLAPVFILLSHCYSGYEILAFEKPHLH